MRLDTAFLLACSSSACFALAVGGCESGGNAGPRADAAAGSSARGGGGGASGSAGGGGIAGGGGGAAGSAGAGGASVCATACEIGRACCGGGCVNLQNDPRNCGACGNVCSGSTPHCGDGACKVPPCNPQVGPCPPDSICCGSACCPVNDICCQDQGPISVAPTCFKPTAAEPTCPQGCAPQCKSDRNQKWNITPADTDAILKKVGRLPISHWTYVEEPAAVRHLGPMAQDFRTSFGLGDDDRRFHSVDAHGVALAAIQALERLVSQQERRIEKLEHQNRALGRRLRALDDRGQPAQGRR